MIHHFNTEIAQIYGIEEAIMIDNLFFWIIKNEANDKNFFDGRYWTFNSVKSYNQLFPYMTESKIYRILNKLVNKDIIVKDNFNENAFDRKGWYAFSDNGISILQKYDYHFTKMGNGYKQNGKTIADIKQDINTDTKESTKVDKKEKEESVDEWKHDYNVYKKMVLDSANELKLDIEFKNKQESYYQNINYDKSIDKGCDYWLSEIGYRKCKQAKTKINMISRLKNNFDKNKIYYPYNNKNTQKSVDLINDNSVIIIDGTKYK